MLSTGAVYAQEQFEVRISFDQPETTQAWKQAMKVLGEEMERESGGRIKVKNYTGGVLHTIGDGLRAVAGGITDITSAYPVYSANSFQFYHAPGLPLALPNADLAALRVIDELYPKYFKDEYEKVGILLGFNAVTPSYDILTRNPVKSLDDLKGLKIRAAGGALTEIVERLGATPITMTITDTYTAFQQGVLDGVALNTADMAVYRLHEVGKYNYRIGVSRVPIPYGLNKDFYESLPDDLKKVVDAALLNAGYNYTGMYKSLTSDALEAMKAAGIVVTEISPEDRKRAMELLDPMWQGFVEKYPTSHGHDAKDLIADMRALSEKYGSFTDEDIRAIKDTQPVEGLR